MLLRLGLTFLGHYNSCFEGGFFVFRKSLLELAQEFCKILGTIRDKIFRAIILHRFEKFACK